MKFSYIILAVAVFATGIIAKKQEIQKSETKIEPVTITTTLLASVLAPMFSNLISGFIGSLFQTPDYQDTVIYGRSMRIKMCGDACVQITDRASGITVVGTGASVQEAVGEASQKMFHELLDKKLLSLHDLCNLNIHFPHPDTVNCPGVTINTCSLIQVTTFTNANCINKHGDSYCETNKNRCTNHLYETFMHEYCYKTCTNGLCGANPTAPVNICQVGRVLV